MGTTCREVWQLSDSSAIRRGRESRNDRTYGWRKFQVGQDRCRDSSAVEAGERRVAIALIGKRRLKRKAIDQTREQPRRKDLLDALDDFSARHLRLNSLGHSRPPVSKRPQDPYVDGNRVGRGIREVGVGGVRGRRMRHGIVKTNCDLGNTGTESRGRLGKPGEPFQDESSRMVRYD